MTQRNADGWRPTTAEEDHAIGEVLYKQPGGERDREWYLEVRARREERDRVPWFPLRMLRRKR